MYTYYDSEPEERHSKKILIVIIISAISILAITALIGIGLSRGNPLDFEEKVFSTYSTDSSPSATCLDYNKSVISTMEIYQEFIDTCNWTVLDAFTASSLQDEVAILYFVKDTSFDQPFAFYDYPFMVDGAEVIRMRENEWDNPTGIWYVYMIFIPKDDLGSGQIVFD